MSKLSLAEQFRSGRVWFVTGASRGIGRALCEHLLEGGESVVCTARNRDAVLDLAERHPGRALALSLDVTQDESVRAAVAAGVAHFGRIDIVVNNAGYGIVGALEEVPEPEVHRIFDTNVYGPYRVTRALLPHLRRQGSGHIMNMSSVLGFVGKAGFCLYSATKFALTGMTEALAEEVAPFGIRVTVLEPGSFRTDFRGEALYQAPRIEAYQDGRAAELRAHLEKTDGKQPGDPKRAARVILAVANAPKPPFQLAMGEKCVTTIRSKLRERERELDEWLELSHATSFPDALV